MPVKIGGIDLTAVNVGGATEIKRIYVGNQYAWPGNATAKVEWIGSVIASGTTNTFVAHVPGDLLVVAACAATNSVPPLPTGFASALTNNSGIGLRIGWKVATTSNTPVGTWTGAVWNSAYVFRNANTTTPFGGIEAASDTKATSATITMTDTTGDSLLCYGFHNNGTSGSWGATPAGYINKNAVARMANLQKIDSQTDGKLIWSSTAGLVNFKNWVFEVLPGELAAANAVAAADMPVGAIKGNADSGLYHLPTDPHYDETVAEQTFTTEAEAKAAGYIKYTKRRKKS